MSGAPDILGRARELVDPAIAAALGGLCEELRVPAEYHFKGRGKGTRPALAILSAEAVGASPETAVPGAVAIELIHDFSLIHDDIIDNDAERRHRPTVWAKFGTGVGVVVGDALHALAFEVLLSDPSPPRVKAAKSLAEAVSAMIAGQSMDMAFEELPSVTLEQCLAMEQGKTGALLSYGSSVGAILAGADETVVEDMADFGAHMGVAFQAVDDLLGIWGDPERTGKPAGADLRERKKSVPVVIALNSDTPAAEELADLYARPDWDAGGVDAARALVEAGGGREHTQALARAHYDLAVSALDSLSNSEGVVVEVVEEMRSLAEFIVGRDF
ncbi:MAG: polyprenyl synthetase family protein [Acidimicrobiia bacterium]|nr:polyprenyl synthetase family protein [bacterium]MXZ79082.1 polyprenyl synthetase family protein [Acidimicrobiia bacterium]MYB10005.1 polyprenyl synthetase family protein [Acidimicrobiia bacterium]MYE72426.1 polyprenyl synthetase family protein [Acidimicrobiia bacterium]MYG59743.1 polyprenyl synthetase family protein [Acidimicrobiia bacterium]